MTRYETMPLLNGQTLVAREKMTGLLTFVMVPVMSFDSEIAAKHWMSGQLELSRKGRKAGFDSKQVPADHMDLQHRLG